LCKQATESNRELAWLMPTHEASEASESWLGLCQPTKQASKCETNTNKKETVAGGWWVGWGRAQPNQPTGSNKASNRGGGNRGAAGEVGLWPKARRSLLSSYF
jgi:hypothetical protein